MIIFNARILTRDGENPWFERGAICLEKDRIVEVGEQDDVLSRYPQHERLDAKGKLLCPSFINAHNHIYSALARGVLLQNYAPENFREILQGMWWNLDEHLDLSMVAFSAKATMFEAIRAGVTTMLDHHASYGAVEGSLQTLGEIAKEMGIRSSFCFEISDRFGKDVAARALEENLNYVSWVQNQDPAMFQAHIGLHASFTLSDQTLALIQSKQKAGVGYHLHIAEGRDDIVDAQKRGFDLVEHLRDYGILGPKTLLIHGIYLDGKARKKLAETDTMLIHNPQSNMSNAVGYCPVLDYLQDGVLVGLGTDGYTQDMLESAMVAELMMRHQYQDARVGWVEAPTLLFENNPRIVSRLFGVETGILKAGAQADLILLDYPNYTPMNGQNANGHFHFVIRGGMVTHTMAAGRWLMKDSVVQNMDENDMRQEAEELAAKLWAKMNRRHDE